MQTDVRTTDGSGVDPFRCPDCGHELATLASAVVGCPACGFNVAHPLAGRIWEIDVRAAELSRGLAGERTRVDQIERLTASMRRQLGQLERERASLEASISAEDTQLAALVEERLRAIAQTRADRARALVPPPPPATSRPVVQSRPEARRPPAPPPTPPSSAASRAAPVAPSAPPRATPAAPLPAPPSAPRVVDVAAPVGAPPPPSSAPPSRRRLWRGRAPSVEVVLVGLGALLLVVATVVFVVFTWSRFNPVQKGAVLVLATAALTALCVVVARRGLTVTAEALSVVAAAFALADVYGIQLAVGPAVAWQLPWAFGLGAVSAGMLALSRWTRLKAPAFGALVVAQAPLVVLASLAQDAGPAVATSLVGVAALDLLAAARLRTSRIAWVPRGAPTILWVSAAAAWAGAIVLCALAGLGSPTPAQAWWVVLVLLVATVEAAAVTVAVARRKRVVGEGASAFIAALGLVDVLAVRGAVGDGAAPEVVWALGLVALAAGLVLLGRRAALRVPALLAATLAQPPLVLLAMLAEEALAPATATALVVLALADVLAARRLERAPATWSPAPVRGLLRGWGAAAWAVGVLLALVPGWALVDAGSAQAWWGAGVLFAAALEAAAATALVARRAPAWAEPLSLLVAVVALAVVQAASTALGPAVETRTVWAVGLTAVGAGLVVLGRAARLSRPVLVAAIVVQAPVVLLASLAESAVPASASALVLLAAADYAAARRLATVPVPWVPAAVGGLLRGLGSAAWALGWLWALCWVLPGVADALGMPAPSAAATAWAVAVLFVATVEAAALAVATALNGRTELDEPLSIGVVGLCLVDVAVVQVALGPGVRWQVVWATGLSVVAAALLTLARVSGARAFSIAAVLVAQLPLVLAASLAESSGPAAASALLGVAALDHLVATRLARTPVAWAPGAVSPLLRGLGIAAWAVGSAWALAWVLSVPAALGGPAEPSTVQVWWAFGVLVVATLEAAGRTAAVARAGAAAAQRAESMSIVVALMCLLDVLAAQVALADVLRPEGTWAAGLALTAVALLGFARSTRLRLPVLVAVPAAQLPLLLAALPAERFGPAAASALVVLAALDVVVAGRLDRRPVAWVPAAVPRLLRGLAVGAWVVGSLWAIAWVPGVSQVVGGPPEPSALQAWWAFAVIFVATLEAALVAVLLARGGRTQQAEQVCLAVVGLAVTEVWVAQAVVASAARPEVVWAIGLAVVAVVLVALARVARLHVPAVVAAVAAQPPLVLVAVLAEDRGPAAASALVVLAAADVLLAERLLRRPIAWLPGTMTGLLRGLGLAAWAAGSLWAMAWVPGVASALGLEPASGPASAWWAFAVLLVATVEVAVVIAVVVRRPPGSASADVTVQRVRAYAEPLSFVVAGYGLVDVAAAQAAVGDVLPAAAVWAIGLALLVAALLVLARTARLRAPTLVAAVLAQPPIVLAAWLTQGEGAAAVAALPLLAALDWLAASWLGRRQVSWLAIPVPATLRALGTGAWAIGSVLAVPWAWGVLPAAGFPAWSGVAVLAVATLEAAAVALVGAAPRWLSVVAAVAATAFLAVVAPATAWASGVEAPLLPVVAGAAAAVVLAASLRWAHPGAPDPRWRAARRTAVVATLPAAALWLPLVVGVLLVPFGVLATDGWWSLGPLATTGDLGRGLGDGRAVLWGVSVSASDVLLAVAVLVVTAALVTVVLAPAGSRSRAWFAAAVASGGLLAVVGTVAVGWDVPILALVAATLVPSAALVGVTLVRPRPSSTRWRVAAVPMVLTAAAWAGLVPWATVGTLAVLTALGVLAVRRGLHDRLGAWTSGATAATGVLAEATVVTTALALAATPTQTGLAMVGAATVLSGFAWLGDARAPWWSPVVEGVAVLASLVGAAVVVASGDAQAVSVALTLGAVAAAAHVLRPRRRAVAAWIAAALGLCVVWVRLWVADVQAVDAYTLPAAGLLLVAGWLQMRRHPTLGSWPALGPGLLVAVVPPVVLALLNGDVVRPLAVLVVAVAVTVLGALRRLSAPLTIGAVTAAVIALDQLFPVVLAMPRWLTLGAIGALLIYVGATFERRRTQARTAVQRYRDLR